MKTRVLVFWLLLVFQLLSGCAANKNPLERALSRSQTLVRSSRFKAQDHAERRDMLSLQARYNPCQCHAPPMELHLYGAWRRHILRGDEALLEEMTKVAELAATSRQLLLLRIEGQFKGQFDELAGVEYPVFFVEGFTTDEAH